MIGVSGVFKDVFDFFCTKLVEVDDCQSYFMDFHGVLLSKKVDPVCDGVAKRFGGLWYSNVPF